MCKKNECLIAKDQSNPTQLQFLAFLFASSLPVKTDNLCFLSLCLFHTVLAFPVSFRFTWNASFPVALANHLSHFLLPVSILDVYHLGIDFSIVCLELWLDVSIPAVPVNYKLLEGGDMSLLASYATVGKQKCSINTCEIRKKINAKLKKIAKTLKGPFVEDQCLWWWQMSRHQYLSKWGPEMTNQLFCPWI